LQQKSKHEKILLENLLTLIEGGSDLNALRISAMALTYSWVAEYCTPVWIKSAHVNKIDTQLNTIYLMKTITGTIKSTPVHWLPVLSNITHPPPTLINLEYTHSYENETSTFWIVISGPPILKDINHNQIQKLKSRKPFSRLAQPMIVWFRPNLQVDQWMERRKPNHTKPYWKTNEHITKVYRAKNGSN